MRITRNLAASITLALLLAGTACGAPRAASSSQPAARVVPTTAPATADTVAPATGTAVNPTAVDPTAVNPTDPDLSDVDRSLDELDHELTDIRQALSQTQEGDVDQ